VLQEVGLTPDRALVPSEFREPPSYSIGLIGYGRQAERIGETALYVLPSPGILGRQKETSEGQN
jgi:hypothetical protein